MAPWQYWGALFLLLVVLILQLLTLYFFLKQLWDKIPRPVIRWGGGILTQPVQVVEEPEEVEEVIEMRHMGDNDGYFPSDDLQGSFFRGTDISAQGTTTTEENQ